MTNSKRMQGDLTGHLMIDSGASFHAVGPRLEKYLTNVQTTQPMTVNTGGGQIQLHKKGELVYNNIRIEEVWYNPSLDRIGGLLSQYEIAKQRDWTFTTRKDGMYLDKGNGERPMEMIQEGNTFYLPYPETDMLMPMTEGKKRKTWYEMSEKERMEHNREGHIHAVPGCKSCESGGMRARKAIRGGTKGTDLTTMYADLICPGDGDINNDKYLLHCVVGETKYGLVRTLKKKTSVEVSTKFKEIIYEIQALTTPGFPDEDRYKIERCKHDPGSEFKGKFVETLNDFSIVNASGETNRHTSSHTVEGANGMLQVIATKLLHTALGESDKYRGLLQIEAMVWARTLLNKKPMTENQKEHGKTPEQQQLGVEGGHTNAIHLTWGCLAYGWTDKIKREVKCSDRGYFGIWVGIDSYTSCANRIVPITRDPKSGEYQLHPTRTSVRIKSDETKFPLKEEVEDQMREQIDIMTDTEMRRYMSKYPTTSELKNKEYEQQENGIFEVEDIIDHERTKVGKNWITKYKVTWKGYDEDHDRWMEEKDLSNAKDILRKYKENCK